MARVKNRYLIDWAEIIKDLMDKGFTHQQIADDVGVCRRAISGWAAGVTREPSFSRGSKLMDVYRTVYGTTDRTTDRKETSR